MLKAPSSYFSGALHAVVLPPTSIALQEASDRSVDILTVRRAEKVWEGAKPDWHKAVPNKPLLDFNGKPCWPEFVVLRLLEKAGWTGAWVKNWSGRAFWSDPLVSAQLPPIAEAIYQKVARGAKSRGGCWDLLAQRDEQVLFVESKQTGKDRIRSTQRAWLEHALKAGVPLSSFMIVEFTRSR